MVDDHDATFATSLYVFLILRSPKQLIMKKTAQLLLIACILWSIESQATHSRTFELFYRWVSDSTYEITLVTHLNTVNVPLTYPVQVSSISQARNATVQLSKVNSPTSSPIHMGNCEQFPLTNYKEYIYRGNYTFPTRASDWIISLSECCLSSQFAMSVSGVAVYLECGLNNLDFPSAQAKNNSPFWHNPLPNVPGHTNDTVINYMIQGICANRSLHLDQSVVEYQGDAIKYERYQPESMAGRAMTMINGFSFNYPLPLNPRIITYDSLTGRLSFTTPHIQQGSRYLVGLKATEYRNDTTWIGSLPIVTQKEIGFVKRILIISVESDSLCTDNDITFSDYDNANTVITQRTDSCNTGYLRFGLTDRVKCNSIDPKGSDILMIRQPQGDTMGIQWVQNTCWHDGATRQFDLTLDSALLAGHYWLMFQKGTDSNTIFTECGKELPAYGDTLHIIVNAMPAGIIEGDSIAGGVYSNRVDLNCNASEFQIHLSEPALVSSIDPLASEFALTEDGTNPPYRIFIDSVIPVNPSAGACRDLRFVVRNKIPAGTYTLQLKQGKDRDSFISYCYDEWPSSEIKVHVDELDIDLGPDTSFCSGSSFALYLQLPQPYSTYLWNNGSTQPGIWVYNFGSYWVRAKDGNGCYAYDTIAVTPRNCVGIATWDPDRVVMFPNPANDQLILEGLDHGSEFELYLMNVQGQRVWHQAVASDRSGRVDLSLPPISDGLYWVRLYQNGRGMLTKKMVIKH